VSNMKSFLLVLTLALGFYVYFNISQPSQDDIKAITLSIPDRIQSVVNVAVNNYQQDIIKNNTGHIGVVK
jgi:hypothetical protein